MESDAAEPMVPATAAPVALSDPVLGPLAFPLDRMIAILGVLLEENDADARPVAPQYTLPGEYTEMEIARVAVYANVRLPRAMLRLWQGGAH